MGEMVEQVAKAIAGVQLFSRFNDWTSDRVEGSPIEICRYGEGDEPEIVVIKRFSGAKKEGDALNEVVTEERAKAAIEAMKGATAPMKEAGAHSNLTLMASYGGDGAFYYVSEENAGEIFDQMIDAALKE